MNIPNVAVATVLSAAFLVACGGGGGSSAVLPTPNSSVASFSQVSAPRGFAWSSAKSSQAVMVSITRSSGAALGQVRVVISNFIETDPTGSGMPIPTMSTDVIASSIAGSNSLATDTANFGRIQWPLGLSQVLVEIFSVTDGSRLASLKASISSIESGVVRLNF
jgi:hypothetical protein